MQDRAAAERLFSTVAGTIDVACAVFVLSAIPPERLRDALANIYRLLRPDGGILLIRDYANYDLSQVSAQSFHGDVRVILSSAPLQQQQQCARR